MKNYLDIDVCTAAKHRIAEIYDNFDRVIVAFSGGKDSGVLLNMAIEVAREKGRLPVDAMCIDFEALYKHTVDFMADMLTRPEVRAHWICLPIHLRNAVSQTQPHWICWEPEAHDIWVRELPDYPGVIADERYFPWFRHGMEFEEFCPLFAEHMAQGQSLATLVAIRADESLNRYRTIKSINKTRWRGHGWTTILDNGTVNAYPIYDWRTEDIWRANGKHGWAYNRIYDLMYLAGLSLHQMRLCQPYGDDQRKGLWLFKMLEPETWAKVVNRVQGANFGNRYVELSGNVLGNIRIRLPDGHTWQSYAEFLLSTMPPPTAAHYKQKIDTFLAWWAKHGVEAIPQEADAKLEAQRKAPSWRRICKCLLKNDYWCKSLSFSQTKKEMERQLALVERYMDL